MIYETAYEDDRRIEKNTKEQDRILFADRNVPDGDVFPAPGIGG